MSNGIWTDKNTYVDFSDTASGNLAEEIASRQTAWDYSGMIGLLPDPDPVLSKRGDSAEILDGLTADSHLCSVIQTRKMGTLKREIKWNPGSANDIEPTSQAKNLRDDLVEDLKEINVYDLVAQILDAPLYGYVPFELSWKPKDGKIKLANIQAKPHRWFGFDEETNEPKFISQASPWDGEELPYGKFVFARHFPSYDNPYGLRLLSRCFWPVTFKRGGLKFWITFAEKFGIPFMLGRYPKGTGENEQGEMLSKLTTMVQSAVAVLPEGSTVEKLGGGSDSKGTSDLFDRLVSAMDKEMSKVIVGQTLTSETSDKGGSYSQGKVHENVLGDYQDSDQMLVKTVFERISKVYAQLNAPGTLPPCLTWFEEEEAKKEFAERDKDLKDTGVKFTKKYYQRQYNLQEDDFELVNPAEPNPEGNDNKPGKEFTEKGKQPKDLDEQVTNKVADEADKEFSALVARVKEIVMSGGSLEEIRNEVLKLKNELSADKLTQIITMGMSGANLAGRLDIEHDNG